MHFSKVPGARRALSQSWRYLFLNGFEHEGKLLWRCMLVALRLLQISADRLGGCKSESCMQLHVPHDSF